MNRVALFAAVSGLLLAAMISPVDAQTRPGPRVGSPMQPGPPSDDTGTSPASQIGAPPAPPSAPASPAPASILDGTASNATPNAGVPGIGTAAPSPPPAGAAPAAPRIGQPAASTPPVRAALEKILPTKPTAPPQTLDQDGVAQTAPRPGQRQAGMRQPAPALGQAGEVWGSGEASADQSGAGVRHVRWDGRQAVRLHLRPAASTTIVLPQDERISQVLLRDDEVFGADQVTSNVLYAWTYNAEAETSLTVLTESGRAYAFVLSADNVKAAVPDLLVMVEAPRAERTAVAAPVELTAMDRLDWLAGDPGGPGPVVAAPGGTRPAGRAAVDGEVPRPPGPSGRQDIGLVAGMPPLGMVGTATLRAPTLGNGSAADLRRVGFRWSDLVEGDYEVRLPEPKDSLIAPIRVVHDGRWTYFDFGSPRGEVTPRPVVARVTADGVRQVINTRTMGDDATVMVAEGLGDFELTHGDRVVCVRLRIGVDEAARKGGPQTVAGGR